jgi:flagellar protein FliJ
MRKFRFNLETVERVRKISEEKALTEFSQAQKKFLDEVAKKEAAVKSREKAMSDRASMQVARAADYATFTNYILGLGRSIQIADQAILRARRQLNAAFRVYVGAKKSRLMIDTLREKAFEEFKKEKSKREQKEVDDLVSMRLVKRSGTAA